MSAHRFHDAGDTMTCGECGREWCGICTPTPSARCPFEYEHDEAPARCELCTDYRPGEVSRDDEGRWVCDSCQNEDDLDDVLEAVREHRGDYLAMVEELVEEVRRLRNTPNNPL